MHDLISLIRAEAQGALGGRQAKGTLVATSYNPDRHAIKGIIVPAGVESGWIPISVAHAGDGYGILAGPFCGSADGLDGDVFDIDFENGDPNTPIAKHTHFSDGDNPPVAKSGELVVKHHTGGSTHFAADGSITTTHKDGGSHFFDKDGHHTLDTKNKNVTVNSGTGSQTFTAKSQSFTAETVSIKGAVKVDGDISQNGNLKSTGILAGASGVTSAGMNVRTA